MSKLVRLIRTTVVNICEDYATVFKEFVEDAREAPLKSLVYAAAVGGLGGLIATRPTQDDLHTALTSASCALALVPRSARNPRAVKYVERARELQGARRLRYQNLLFVALLIEENVADECKNPAVLAEARLQWHAFDWKAWWDERVVDIGVAGKWRYLEEAMVRLKGPPSHDRSSVMLTLSFFHFSFSLSFWFRLNLKHTRTILIRPLRWLCRQELTWIKRDVLACRARN